MKKIGLLTILVLTFLLSGCSLFGSDLEKAFNKVSKEDNFTIDIKISNENGEVVQEGTSQIDGDLMILNMNGTVTEFYFKDDVLYYLYPESGQTVSNVLFPSDLSELDLINDKDYYEVFDIESFTMLSEGLYLSTESYFGLTEVNIEISKYIDVLRGNFENGGITYNVEVTFSDHGETEFDFPSYTEKTTNEIICDYVSGYSYDCNITGDEEVEDYSFGNFLLSFEYDSELEEFKITNELKSVSFEYNPSTKLVHIDDQDLTITEYNQKYVSADFYISDHIFEMLDDLYSIE